MVYYNPYITGWYNPLYNPTNLVFFSLLTCLVQLPGPLIKIGLFGYTTVDGSEIRRSPVEVGRANSDCLQGFYNTFQGGC